MTDHHTHPISARDLSSRLAILQASTSNTTTTTTSHGARSSSTSTNRRPGTSSSFSSSLNKHSNFSKSSTISTVDSRSSAGPQVTHASASIDPGSFSKPRVHQRSRRDTGPGTKSEGGAEGKEMEFKYYGRHSNQWLFNDFSVTDAMAKGFKRVFGRGSGGGDWYENREK
ncbi:hypothetical protein NX059_008843 [Plenodomus lindquistii]|nr:hypothetical protein NX059_008843 [Plenodomus lindquistii]